MDREKNMNINRYQAPNPLVSISIHKNARTRYFATKPQITKYFEQNTMKKKLKREHFVLIKSYEPIRKVQEDTKREIIMLFAGIYSQIHFVVELNSFFYIISY